LNFTPSISIQFCFDILISFLIEATARCRGEGEAAVILKRHYDVAST
jgi:hypothetical protein